MEKREDENQNPPHVLKPVPPMSLGELIEYHKNAGDLQEFLARIEYDRER